MPRSCIPFLQLAVLLVIRGSGPICAYRIYRRLESLGLDVEEAAVYSTIAKLKSKNLIEASEKGPRGRIRYILTAKGLEELQRLIEEKKAIDKLLEEASGGESQRRAPSTQL